MKRNDTDDHNYIVVVRLDMDDVEDMMCSRINTVPTNEELDAVLGHMDCAELEKLCEKLCMDALYSAVSDAMQAAGVEA